MIYCVTYFYMQYRYTFSRSNFVHFYLLKTSIIFFRGGERYFWLSTAARNVKNSVDTVKDIGSEHDIALSETRLFVHVEISSRVRIGRPMAYSVPALWRPWYTNDQLANRVSGTTFPPKKDSPVPHVTSKFHIPLTNISLSSSQNKCFSYYLMFNSNQINHVIVICFNCKYYWDE